MCPTKIVIRFYCASASAWTLAVTAWVILGALVPGSGHEEVLARTGDANSIFRGLSACEERAYRPNKGRPFGGPDLEKSEKKLKWEPLIHFQRRREA
jgi:hypothetical protein